MATHRAAIAKAQRRNRLALRNIAKAQAAAKRRRWPPRPLPLPFTVTVEYKDPEDDLDLEIEKLMGKGRKEGSGYNFVDDLSDMSFGFLTRRVAIARAKRVKKKFGRKIKVRVEGRIWP
jgi:hypothetical protein